MNLEAVCYHEAGHAVTAYLYSIPFDYVTIDPARMKPYQCRGMIKFYSLEGIPENVLVRLNISGPIAQSLYTGLPVHFDVDSSRVFDLQPDDKTAYYEFQSSVRQELLRNWSNVERVAKALMDHGTVWGSLIHLFIY